MKLTSVSSDNDLIRGYLDHALADPQRDAFELRLLQEPELQDQVDLEIALRHGLRAHGAELSDSHAPQTRAPDALSLPPPPQALSRPPPPHTGRRHPALALAASFVAGMVVPALFWFNAQESAPTDPNAGFVARGNVPTLLIDPVRSANTDVVLVVAPNSSLLLLQVPVYPQHADERYSLRIEREDGVAVAELDELVPDGDDLITALVPASSLPSGRYRLDLQSLHAGVVGEQRRIVLRVTSMG